MVDGPHPSLGPRRIRLVWLMSLVLASLMLIGAQAGSTHTESGSSDQTEPAVIAEKLLEEDRPGKARRQLVTEHLDQAPAILKALTGDLEPGSAAEKKRIPWIWRVSIRASETDRAELIREVMRLGLPEADGALHDWQSVVLGGGVVNGLSRSGRWPRQRIMAILEGHSKLIERWRHAVAAASPMAGDEATRTPVRYDALRLLAMADWHKYGEQLAGFLDHENATLQMGAVSGLVDMRTPYATTALLDGFAKLANDRNRGLMIDGLLRTEQRQLALLEAIETGDIPRDALTDKQRQQLLQADPGWVRQQAKKTLQNQ